MDDQRVGRIVRTLRVRREWRQRDIASKAECSQNLVSLIERGHIDLVSLRVLRRVLAVLDATVALELRWRGAALDRLVDEGHALLVGAVARVLRSLGWIVEVEVTYSEFGERGSFDLVAFHPRHRVILVIEVKTDLGSAELTLRKLDEKTRLASSVCLKRFGWRAVRVGRVLVFPETSTLRRRVARHAAVFTQAFPARNNSIRDWLKSPDGSLSGLWFFSDRNSRVAIAAAIGRQRVRKRSSAPNKNVAAT